MVAVKKAPAKVLAHPINTANWLTRDQVADILGCSYMTVKSLGERGVLNPVRDTRPPSLRVVYLFDPAEVAKIPRKFRREPVDTEGELAARVFEMLCEGKTIMEIVMLTRATPEKIEALHESWLDTGGARLTITPSIKATLEELFGGSFASVLEMVQLARAALAKDGTP